MASKTTYELALEIGGKIQGSLGNSVGSVNDKLASIGKAAKTAAKIATAAFAAVKIGDFISDAVDTYSEFSQAMAETSAIASATQEEYQKLEEAALEMGKKTTKSATEAAEALGYMSLAGWSVEDSISALEPVLRLSEATSMDLSTCSDLVTDSMSALGLSVSELTDYLNVAVQANNSSNQSAEDLMNAMIGCGGAAKSAGMDYEQTAAALGVLANNGIKGSEAGTALNSMLVRMTTKDAAKNAFEALGVSIYDSSGEMRNMQDILVELNSAMSGLTQEQKNNYMSAIAGTNYYTQFGYLLEGVAEGADGAASTWTQLTEAFENSDGALDAMADTMTDTLSGAMSIFSSAVDNAKIQLCKVFAPAAKEAIKAVADIIPSIMDKVSDAAQSFYDKAVPAAAIFAGKAIAAFNKVKPTLGDIKNKATAAFVFLRDTGITAFENIKAKIEENKPAIEKVIAVASDLKDKFFEAFEKAKPTITCIADTAIPTVVEVIMEMIGAAASVYQKLDQWNVLIPTITAIAKAIASVKMFKFAKHILYTVKATKALITVFAAEKKALLANAAAKTKEIAQTVASRAINIKDAVAKGASTAATWAQTAATTALNAVMSANPIALVVIAIVALVAAFVIAYKKSETFRAIVAKTFESAKNAANVALTAIATFFTNAWEVIQSIFSGLGQFFQTLWDGVVTIFSDVAGFFGGVFEAAWEAITGVFGSIVDFFGGVWDSIVSVFGTIGTAIADAISGAVKGAINAVLSGAVTIINGFISAINTAISIINAIPGVNIETISSLDVPALATGGIVDQPTLAMIGEGNDSEAVVPLGELWANMKSFISGALGSQSGVSDMFGKVATLAGIRQTSGNAGESITKELYNSVTNNSTVTKSSEKNSSDNSTSIVYSPNITIQGNASKEDVQEALDMSQEKFNRYMAEYKRQYARTSFA